jgi:tRNA modification GTPase
MPDTIAAIATGTQVAAIGIVRLSGERAGEIADTLFTPQSGKAMSASAPRTLVYGRLHDREGALLDLCLCTISRAPHSYTGEDTVEFQCHGSPVVLRTLLDECFALGARQARPGEFTRRAFLNGRLALSSAEAVADIIDAESAESAKNAAGQLAGALQERTEKIYNDLADISAHYHAVLDYPDEDIEPFRLAAYQRTMEEAHHSLSALLATFSRGKLMKDGIPAAIIGRPNAGKSSLLNALLGYERAIVTRIPGTTRDTIEEKLRLGPLTLRLIDTAGIRETEEEIEKIGISRSLLKLSQADIVLGVIDATAPLSEQRQHIQEIASRIRFDEQTLLLLLNKMDLVAEPSSTEDTRVTDGKMVTIPLSAKTGQGLETLKNCRVTVWEKRLKGAEQALLVTNIRHYNALHKAADALELVKAGIASGTPTDLVSQDLRDSLYHLGSILGTITDDEILGRIFERFCIGK